MAQPHGPTLKALGRYRLMAWVVGTALILLVGVAMPLKYFAAQPLGVEILAPIHGFLYVGYLVTVIDLTRHLPVRPLQILAMVTAGLVPFLTFVVEHRMVRKFTAAPLPTHLHPQ